MVLSNDESVGSRSVLDCYEYGQISSCDSLTDHDDNRPNKKNKYNTNNPLCSLYLRKITKTELCKIITNMNNDSFPGLDGISINKTFLTKFKKKKDYPRFLQKCINIAHL
ncbi:Uncharacterized protein FWK35_00018234 [Aphis craccivora]|uniref:Uncharacterized protein n=1 Tax=Aphis craccivora TaxID=307492 RepID=A0A6G0Y2E1_APHCR|nr:Uncharacterized protein FWK35_00018234 [Aphis craccivora]